MSDRSIVLYSAALVATHGACVLLDSFAVRITTLHVFAPFPTVAVGLLLIGSAVVACWGVHRCDVAMLIPQQVILGVAAAGAISAMVLSAFGDGVVRPRAFLVADQAPAVLVAIFHAVAVRRLAALPKEIP